MITNEDLSYWSELDIDLFEEKMHMFGVTINLFTSQKAYYCKVLTVDNRERYEYFHGDIYSAIEQFNARLKEDTEGDCT